MFDDRFIVGYERKTGVKDSSEEDSNEVGWMKSLEFEATSEMEI